MRGVVGRSGKTISSKAKAVEPLAKGAGGLLPPKTTAPFSPDV